MPPFELRPTPLLRLFDDQEQGLRCVMAMVSLRGLDPDAIDRALQALDALKGAAPALEQERPALEALAWCARELRAQQQRGGRR